MGDDILDKCWEVSLKIKYLVPNKSYGVCWYTQARIEIYPHNFKLHKIEDFIDTVLHELAHHLNWVMYGEKGHNKSWKNLCKVIGADSMARHNK